VATNSPLLNDQHCACIDAVLASIQQTGQLIAQCQSCGLPVEDELAANEAQRQLATRLKAAFFPANP
jgi:hypothetical protein